MNKSNRYVYYWVSNTAGYNFLTYFISIIKMSTIQKINKRRMATQFKDRKYYLDICTERLTDNPGIDTSDWLIVQDMMKDKKVMNAIMNAGNPVVMKIGEKTNIFKEFNLSKELYVNNIPGFVKYICAFSCKDDLENLQGRGFCNNKSNEQHVLIMPYFKYGSIRTFRWTTTNFDILKSVLKQTIACVLTAAMLLGFHHNDLHLDNVMLIPSKKHAKKYSDIDVEIDRLGYKPIIIDLELSKKIPSYIQWEKYICVDLRKMMYSLGDLINASIDVEGITDIIKRLDYLKDPFNECSTQDLLKILGMVDNLTFSQKLIF